MKKLVSLILIMLMLASLCACGDDAPQVINQYFITQSPTGASKENADDTTAAPETIPESVPETVPETVPDEIYTIGICQLISHAALDAATQGVIDRIKAELGEENVEILVEIAGGNVVTCTGIIKEFVSRNVDMIVAGATPVLQAARAATTEIPILGTAVSDYKDTLGLENFNGVVGGNISGTSDIVSPVQQAAMIAQWFPDGGNVGLLHSSAGSGFEYEVEAVRTELERLGYTCHMYVFTDANDLPTVTQAAAAASDIIYIPTDNTAASNATAIDSICRAAGVPLFTGFGGASWGCGLASLSIDYYDLGTATGDMAVQILRDKADIATMEIGYAVATGVYNREFCAELGLVAPEGYVAIAN